MAGSKTWAIVGASRGIGHEFVKQLSARGDNVIATVRQSSLGQAASLWQHEDHCSVYECDMLSETSIDVVLTRKCRELQVRLTDNTRRLLSTCSNSQSNA